MTKALGGEASWNMRNVAVDAFGSALGNSIVKSMKAYELDKAIDEADGAIQKMFENVDEGALTADSDNGKFSPVANDFGQELDAMARASSRHKPKTHVVKVGDSLSELAEQYYGDAFWFTEIAVANGINDPNYGIQAGQELVIPNMGLVTDSYKDKLHSYGISEISRLGHEALEAIANFDYSTLFNADYTPNLDAKRELIGYHKRAALTAEIDYIEMSGELSQTSFEADGTELTSRSYYYSNQVAVNGEVRYENYRELPIPEISNLSSGDKAFKWLTNNVGSGGTIVGSAGTAGLAHTLIKAQGAADDILKRAGNLNAYQRAKLDKATDIKDAQKIFSASSKSGQAINTVANSKLGKVAQKIPLLGHGLAWSTVPADVMMAPSGQENIAAQAATASVLGGYAVTAIGTLAGIALAPALGVSAVIGGAALGIGAALGYDFLGYDDDVKQLYKEFYQNM